MSLDWPWLAQAHAKAHKTEAASILEISDLIESTKNDAEQGACLSY